MIRVGLARTDPHYAGLEPPWGPGKSYPELAGLLGDAAGAGPPNHVYAAVRGVLHALGLGEDRFGGADWNPLGELVARGGHVVLKPNFIRHWNPREDGSVEAVITHGSLIRAMADYAFLAVGAEGSVTLAEAPQHDCDWTRISELAGLAELVRFYEDTLGLELGVVDLRREQVRYHDGVIAERHPLPGDPAGYRLVDLGSRSAFDGSGLDPRIAAGATSTCSPRPSCGPTWS
jgi:hypothetical protein